MSDMITMNDEFFFPFEADAEVGLASLCRCPLAFYMFDGRLQMYLQFLVSRLKQ